VPKIHIIKMSKINTNKTEESIETVSDGQISNPNRDLDLPNTGDRTQDETPRSKKTGNSSNDYRVGTHVHQRLVNFIHVSIESRQKLTAHQLYFWFQLLLTYEHEFSVHVCTRDLHRGRNYYPPRPAPRLHHPPPRV